MSSFNPYEEWLEISYPGIVPSYYEMMGVASGETDTAVIEAMADVALARVRACRPGPHATIWTELLDQLADARACLTDPAKRTAYDQLLVDGAVPHKDLALSGAEIDSVDGSSLMPVPLENPDPQPEEPVPVVQAAVAMVEEDPFAPSHLAAEASPLPVAEVVQSTPPPPPPEQLPTKLDEGSTADMVAASRSENHRNLVIVVAGSVVLIGALSIIYILMGNKAGPVAKTTAERPVSKVSTGKDKPARRNTAPSPRPVPHPTPRPVDPPQTMPRPTPAPTPAPTPTPVPAPVPAPTPPPAPTPTPPPAPTPDPESKPLVAAEKVRLAAAFKMVRIALSERNFMVADMQMKIASELARTPEFEAMYQRLDLLVQYTRSFDRLLNQSLSEMQAGSELKIGKSTIAAVVEVTDDQLTIKLAGVLKRFPRKEMSKGLVMGIAQTKFDMQRSGSVMAVGTYLATCKGSNEMDREKARTYWRQAVTMGAQIGDLEKVLDDTYDFAGEPGE